MPACLQCSQPAVVQLRYEKRDLCGGCFSSLFEDRVRRANREFQLLRRGDRVAVAVSGGKDSAALLYSLDKLAKPVGAELVPVLIDEGIAGYRSEAVKCAQALCEQMGYSLQLFSYKELVGTTMDDAMRARDQMPAGQKGTFTSCSFCGVWRRKGFEHAAKAVGATSLATGHNLDDAIQTFLMNLLRGEPNRDFSLGTNEPLAGQTRRLKPLLYCPERECALYAELNNLPYYRGECPYASEGFRQPVKAFLNDTENQRPGVKFALLKSYLEYERSSSSKTLPLLVECAHCGDPTTGTSCRACQYTRVLGVTSG